MVENLKVILKFLCDAIQLCNDNAGFISAILAIIAIVATVKVTKAPYKEKLDLFNSFLIYNKEGIYTITLYIANIGNVPILFKDLLICNGKSIVGECHDVFGDVLMPGDIKTYKFDLDNINAYDDIKLKTMNIIVETKKKKFKFKNSWALG